MLGGAEVFVELFAVAVVGSRFELGRGCRQRLLQQLLLRPASVLLLLEDLQNGGAGLRSLALEGTGWVDVDGASFEGQQRSSPSQ